MKTDPNLNSKDDLTELVKSAEIVTWIELMNYVQNLPYGRNSNRTDFSLVLREMKGSCSSKHAFLKQIADLNNIENCKLILGIYKMNEINTPDIGKVLTENSLDHIPEAHCYLKFNDERIDLTSINSNFKRIEKDLIQEIEISPEQVSDFKVTYHRKFLKDWIKGDISKLNFDEIWEIREKCIENLTKKACAQHRLTANGGQSAEKYYFRD